MSTRSQILTIEKGKIVANHYHHCDGYTQGVGQELFDALNKNGDPTDVDLMMAGDENYEVQNANKAELTPKNITHHVDIEYLYYIDRDSKTIYVLNEDWWDMDGEIEDFKWDFNSEWTKSHRKVLDQALIDSNF